MSEQKLKLINYLKSNTQAEKYGSDGYETLERALAPFYGNEGEFNGQVLTIGEDLSTLPKDDYQYILSGKTITAMSGHQGWEGILIEYKSDNDKSGWHTYLDIKTLSVYELYIEPEKLEKILNQ